MFAVKTAETRITKLHILTNQIGVHSLRWGGADVILSDVLVELYHGNAVELKIVNGEDTTDTLNRLVFDRANEFVEVLQEAFASASFELLLSVVTVDERDYEVPDLGDSAYAEAVAAPEWLGKLITVVEEKIKTIDNKYYPLIVSELCNPTVTKKESVKKTTKK